MKTGTVSTMNLIDYFNDFVNRAEGSGLDANTRSLYFAILTAFNRNRFPSTLRLSNDYLITASGIKDRFVLNRCKNRLISLHFIDAHSDTYALRADTAQIQHNSNTPY